MWKGGDARSRRLFYVAIAAFAAAFAPSLSAEETGNVVACELGPFEVFAELEPARVWTDDRGRDWPVAWRLSCRPCSQTLTVEAELDDQRMDTMLVYWEGLVSVRDAAGKRLGAGYMELTGY